MPTTLPLPVVRERSILSHLSYIFYRKRSLKLWGKTNSLCLSLSVILDGYVIFYRGTTVVLNIAEINPFRSDTGLRSRHPIHNPTFIASDRIAKTPYADTIN